MYPVTPSPTEIVTTGTTAATGGDVTFAVIAIAVAVVLGVAALLIARRRTA